MNDHIRMEHGRRTLRAILSMFFQVLESKSKRVWSLCEITWNKNANCESDDKMEAILKKIKVLSSRKMYKNEIVHGVL